MKRQKARKGFSLIELLVAIVVLAILGAITITAGTAAQRRARVTSAMTVFDNYRLAFNTAVMDHPGLVTDREDAWVAPDGTGTGALYTSKESFDRLVGYMNRSLSLDLQLTWNADGYYESSGNDPWGGKYVLLEYPGSDSPDYWDFSTFDNKAALRLSIWCTGPDSDIIIPDGDNCVLIRDHSVGIAIQDVSGNITSETHGSTTEVRPFLDSKIRIYK